MHHPPLSSRRRCQLSLDSLSPASPSPPITLSNDDVEPVIQMATFSRSSPDGRAPLRDTRTQLFVGNLPYRVRWQDLKDLFRKAGTVLSADVSLGPDNRSRGYGTVLLATAEEAGRAIDMFNGYSWQSRTLEVRPDRLPPDLETPAAGATHVNPFAAHSFTSEELDYAAMSGGQDTNSKSLFVGNLPFHCQWQDLKGLFRQAGTITRADVALGPDGRSRGFGTVVFATEVDADRAVNLFNGYEYNGHALEVHHDKYSQAAQPTLPVQALLQGMMPATSATNSNSPFSSQHATPPPGFQLDFDPFLPSPPYEEYNLISLSSRQQQLHQQQKLQRLRLEHSRLANATSRLDIDSLSASLKPNQILKPAAQRRRLTSLMKTSSPPTSLPSSRSTTSIFENLPSISSASSISQCHHQPHLPRPIYLPPPSTVAFGIPSHAALHLLPSNNKNQLLQPLSSSYTNNPCSTQSATSASPSNMSSKSQAFPYAHSAFSLRAVQDAPKNVKSTSSMKRNTQDEAKLPTDESVIGKHFVIGAESVLKSIQDKEMAIEATFYNFRISRSEYAILAGFNEALMRSGTGYLPEIHVFCSVDISQRVKSLVTKLGKILSPLPGALFTPSAIYRIPVFKNDETLLSWDELVFSRTEGYADICSAVAPTSIQVVSRPQGSWSNGGTSAPLGFSGNDLKGSDADNKDKDDAGNDEGEDDKSGDREGDDGNPDHEDPDDPTDGSSTSLLPIVSFDAQAKVYANAANTVSPKVLQKLQVNGRLIIQSHAPCSKPKQLPKTCVEFKKLKFQGSRAIPTMGYEQVHARVVIDAKEELTRVDAIKPSRTPAIGLESTEVTTRQSSSALGFSGSSGFGSPSIKGMFSGHLGAESSSHLETRNYGSRITQGDSDGVVWWGFNIDDPHEQEAGKELLDTLPSAEFEFLGKNASLPPRLHVEVASCWSLISSIENRQSWIQALIGLAKPKGLSYSNLCQIVQLEIPNTLLEDCEYKSLTDVMQSGCHTQVQLFEGSDLVCITPSVLFLDEPVPPDSVR